jgi:hypothetical protein
MKNYINLLNVARVRFTETCAEVFYTGRQSESITDQAAIENRRGAIGAEASPSQRRPRSYKAMDVAQPAATPMSSERRA